MKYTTNSLFCRDFLLKVNPRNSFEIPKLSCVSINLTNRYIVAEKKHSLFAIIGLALLSGQQPKVLRAKKSVAAFKLKENSILGCQLTLRKAKMEYFLEAITFLVFPQLKRTGIFSERALSSSSSLQLGFTEFLAFPELEKNFELFETLQGCSLQLHTNAKTVFEKNLLLSSFNLQVYSKKF